MQVYLKTERLLLRPFTRDDIDLLVALDSDPEVMRYLTGGVPTPRTAIEREILPRILRTYVEAPGFGCWAAIEKTAGEFVGWFSLGPTRSDPAEAELGYRLRRDAWGHGYATEGARALLRKGFTELGVQRIIATAYEENLASRRVLEKIGLRPERRFRMTPGDLAAQTTFEASSAILFDGEDVVYALDRRTWEQGS